MKFYRAGPDAQAIRAVNGVLAALYFVVAGMLVYFRLGPFERLISRFEVSETPLPAWFVPVFTGGIAVVGLFLILRGLGYLRKFLQK